MEAFEKYARQIALAGFGEVGQKRLADSSVVVVGAGGVGSGALPLLAASGIGRIALVDCDVVSLSNLHRQTLYDAAQVGQSKARAAAARLSALNPDCEISFFDEQFGVCEKFESLIARADLCIDATDSFASRTAVSEVCSRVGRLEILASAGGYVSQMMVLGGGFYFDKYVGADSTAASEKSRGLPIFPAAAHLSGVWAAGAAIAHLAGVSPLEAGVFRIFDFRTGVLRKFNLLA